MQTITPDFRQGMILAVAAAKNAELFWLTSELEDPRKMSAEDLASIQAVLGDMVAIFGYRAAEQPTKLADPLECAIGI
jgi:hypothetical protein